MIHNSRFFFSSDLFSLWVFIPGILFPKTLLAAPHAILGKKVPRNPKQRTLFPVTFFQGFYKIQTLFLKVFIFWFFPETLFPWDFLTQIQCPKLQNVQCYKISKVTIFLNSIYTVLMFIWPGLGHYWRGLEHRDIFCNVVKFRHTIKLTIKLQNVQK